MPLHVPAIIQRPSQSQTTQAQSASVVPLTVKGAASQTADLLRVLDSADGEYLVVDGQGTAGSLDPLEPPYQITPVEVRVGTAGEYSSSSPGNNFHLASHVKNTGSRATVAVFGEGIAEGASAKAWGGNFVAYVNHATSGNVIGVEVNHGRLVSSTGEAYGVVIASAGDYSTAAHIQMQSNTAAAKPAYGINFSRNGSVDPVTTALIRAGSSVTCDVGIDLSSGSYTTAAIKTGGGIQFPATQVPSSDANTLDDYEEGTWTPALTFATPGNVSVTYSNQAGRYIKVGKLVMVYATIITSAFTHTTASGQFRITGLPFTVDASSDHSGSIIMSGWTKANYTQVGAQLASNTTLVQVLATGSGQALSNLTSSDVPSGGTVSIRLNATYQATA